MREEGGLAVINEAIEKLRHSHAEHIKLYGAGNDKRLTGRHETCDMSTFKSGVGDRGASIRIPTQTNIDGKGYLEDRRPASNVDPYIVAALLVSTTCLDGDKKDEMIAHYEKWAEERGLLNAN